MKKLFQLWGVPPKNGDWDRLVSRAVSLVSRCRTDVAVLGIGAPKEVYAKLLPAFRERNVEAYLWVPLFSELEEYADFDPLVTAEGTPLLPEAQQRGFRFRCPGSGRNRALMEEAWSSFLSAGAFDGLFFDRIRYPSFQYGLNGVSGCFCPECLNIYERFGYSPEALRRAVLRFRKNGSGQADEPVFSGYSLGRWTFSDPDLQDYFDARCRVITEAVAQACRFAREHGLKAGLDLFTPALGYWAGQQFDQLLPLADFVKPMMYFRTDAPAGLPYELRVMEETLGLPQGRAFRKMCGAETVSGFVQSEIRCMEKVKQALGASADLYFAAEYNAVPKLCEISRETLREDLPLLTAAEGVGASWSLFGAPDALVDEWIRIVADEIPDETNGGIE